MPLFLPHAGWHIHFVQTYGDLQNPPLTAREIVPFHASFWSEEKFPAELVLAKEFDITRLQGHPSVRAIKEVWYFTSEDRVTAPDKPRGREIDVAAGTAWMYFRYDQVMADLASCNPDLQLLWTLHKKGPATARMFAKAVLDGDLTALPALAHVLEELGHKSAAIVRQLVQENPAPVGVAAKVVAAQAPVVRGLEAVLIGGMPGSGKSTLARTFTERGFARLNRDEMGGTIEAMVPKLSALLAQGKSVVLDNLFPTYASRGGFIEAARKAKAGVRFLLVETSLEDSQFNVCVRMMEKCGRVLEPDDHKTPAIKKDPSLFPAGVLYVYRKEFEAPSTSEGFDAVEKIPFQRVYPSDWVNKALILDFDGTLRTHEGAEKFPLHPSEVRAYTERAAKLREYQKRGYLLLGASNQSGVSKGLLTRQQVEDCFAETQRQLGVTLTEVKYCPHAANPIRCYCRKPGPGMGVELIVTHKLDPRQCIYVGDQTTDRTFAARCGFPYADQAEFFKK